MGTNINKSDQQIRGSTKSKTRNGDKNVECEIWQSSILKCYGHLLFRLDILNTNSSKGKFHIHSKSLVYRIPTYEYINPYLSLVYPAHINRLH